MIYIVEIPHQRQPFCWSAENEEEVIGKICQSTLRYNDTPGFNATFAEWVRYNGHDLYNHHVFMDAASAIAGLEKIGGHGAFKAIDALRAELKANGELPVQR